MKEIRAVVAGVAVLAILIAVWAFWRRPAPGMSRIRAFRVEIRDTREGRMLTMRIPGFLAGEAARVAARAMREHDFRAFDFEHDGNRVTITPQEILDAADRSASGRPEILTPEGADGPRIAVSREAQAVHLHVDSADRWDDGRADITVPRSLLEALAQEKALTGRELLARLDALGPGDLVEVRGDNGYVRVTAEAK